MISRIQFQIVIVVGLIAFGSSGQDAFSQDGKPVDLRTIEQKLSTALQEIANSKKSGQPTTASEKRLDDAFEEWSPMVAPAAHHSAGWPNDNNAAQAQMQKRALVVQMTNARLEEFVRLLLADHEADPLKAVQAKTYCQLLAKLIMAEVIGLPPNEKKILDKSLAAIETPVAFARAIAMAHLYVGKHQVGNRRLLIDEINKVIEQLQKQNSGQPNDAKTRKQLSEAVKLMTNDCLVRSVSMSEVMQRRTLLESLTKTGPHFRSYLIARQIHRSTKTQAELAERNKLKSAVVDALQARRKLASDLEQEYLRRSGDPNDRKLDQVTKEVCLQQDTVRGLQESMDSRSFAVKTYTTDSKTVASEHLKRASRLLNAVGDSELAKQLDGVVGKLIDQK